MPNCTKLRLGVCHVRKRGLVQIQFGYSSSLSYKNTRLPGRRLVKSTWKNSPQPFHWNSRPFLPPSNQRNQKPFRPRSPVTTWVKRPSSRIRFPKTVLSAAGSGRPTAAISAMSGLYTSRKVSRPVANCTHNMCTPLTWTDLGLIETYQLIDA